MTRSILTLVFIYAFTLTGFSQSFQKNLHFDESSNILSHHLINETGFYDINEIESINLDFYDSDYWDLMHEYYDTENYVLASLTYKGEVFDSVGVQFKGQTSYRKPAQQNSEKLSFDVKMDVVIEGQEVDSYSTFNFNNSYQDHTFMRELVYTKLAGKHIPAARANYIELYLNGEYWGLYPNVQQVNNDMVAEWFMDNDGIRWRADVPKGITTPPGNPGGPNWGDGTAALNYHGIDSAEYQQYYTLKSSKMEDPWSYLIDACQALDNDEDPNYLDNLAQYINLDATLWFLATEILFSDDDSYIHKGKMDYSLYYDQESGLMVPLEIDGNSVMQSRNDDWNLFYNVNDENYPLLNKLLTIPALRQRYLAHVKTLLNDNFTEESQDLIDELQIKITSLIQDDPKSPTSLDKFNTEVGRLKNFIADRRNYLETHPELQSTSPEINNTYFLTNGVNWTKPGSDDVVDISTTVNHQDGIEAVKLYYSRSLTGNFSVIDLEKTGSNYTGSLTNFNPGENIRFYIEAIANDSQKTRAYYPSGAEHEVLYFKVKQETLEDQLVVINEFMASNTKTVADQDGEFDDWIELYNLSNNTIDLGGYFLSDKENNLGKWEIPEGTEIDANDYLIVWADENGSEEGLHANFKLSKLGESIYLSNPDTIIMDYIEFGEQETDLAFARNPNGTGDFVIQEATFAENNENSTSVISLISESQFQLFPNPADNYVKLINNKSFTTNDKISIFDSFGKILYFSRNDLEASIDISSWIPGIYFVRFNDQLRKLIVY